MIPRLVDLSDREIDLQKEHADLLAELLAVAGDAPARPRPRWGRNTATMLDLELAPVRIGRFPSADDLVPGDVHPKRGRRRR